MFDKTFKTTFQFIILAEILSIFAFLLPSFNQAAFLIISLLFLIISIINLRLGLYIILAELFIGSMGYIFSFTFNGLIIPIRISFWLIILSVWIAHKLLQIKKTKRRLNQYKNTLLPLFGILFFFVIVGLINAILRDNSFNNIFFDINAWLYFILVLPFYDIFIGSTNNHREKFLSDIKSILFAGVIWICLKTLVLLYIFSHEIITLSDYTYHWMRYFRLGEITKMPSGFYRIFFQSQIFVLLSFFIFIWKLSKQKTFSWLKGKNNIILFMVSAFCLSIILVSFSRSFWAGLILGLITYAVFIYATNKNKFYSFFKNILNIGLVFLVSLVIITIVIKIPWPKQNHEIAASTLIAGRARQIYSEAGASSRWNLLPVLSDSIMDNFILGRGFGATITYTSDDPRVRETQIDGQYTTYAFEWGWLDIWLKLGLFGLLAYIWLLYSIIKKTWLIKNRPEFSDIIPWGIGVIIISTVSIFSPYLNHPLGIGFIILASVIVDYNKIAAQAKVLP